MTKVKFTECKLWTEHIDSYIATLILSVIVVGDGAFGRCLGHEWERFLALFPLCEDIGEVSSLQPQEDSHQNATLLAP